MNWKVVVIGGVVYYVALFTLSMVLGIVVHDPQSGLLAEAYGATMSFWRPELFQEKPDPDLMLKMWIPSGLLCAFLAAGIYSVIRSSLAGPAWMRGLKFGIISSIFAIIGVLGYRGVFNLPDQIWTWWTVGAVVMYLPAGVVLGWIAQKLAPANS
ncbi:MAG: hypothetical protein AB7T20_10115 [Steroidobacteraceae bacterium]